MGAALVSAMAAAGAGEFREVIATSENMLPRGVEHDFALNSLGGGAGGRRTNNRRWCDETRREDANRAATSC